MADFQKVSNEIDPFSPNIQGRRVEETDRVQRFVCITQIFIVILVISGIVAASVVYESNQVPYGAPIPAPLTNLDFSKNAVTGYYAANYESDLSQMTTTWLQALSNTAAIAGKTAVVFDIDDTVLANYPEMLATNFGFIPKLWNEWVDSANASAIAPTLWLWNQFKRHGFVMVFITGRTEGQRNATVVNLSQVGFSGWSGLHMRQPSDHGLTAAVYKNNVRAQLVQQYGYEFVGCIGDQFSDCAGDHTGFRMKVPNYCYYIA
eukprot:TRINITY_DN4317_c0_g1_i2.p1 TRINITY_DN4317_c0_g1~~TRINITY_DN4317_c0_g1_i2.p1  ORF type:complete len:262 (-),score=28.52 TRINITY_DN4317_c0_g1_i2:1534-2319(-)